jgi:hypothetical protein
MKEILKVRQASIFNNLRSTQLQVTVSTNRNKKGFVFS